MKRRITSAFLVFLMVLSLIPPQVMAADSGSAGQSMLLPMIGENEPAPAPQGSGSSLFALVSESGTSYHYQGDQVWYLDDDGRAIIRILNADGSGYLTEEPDQGVLQVIDRTDVVASTEDVWFASAWTEEGTVEYCYINYTEVPGMEMLEAGEYGFQLMIGKEIYPCEGSLVVVPQGALMLRYATAWGFLPGAQSFEMRLRLQGFTSESELADLTLSVVDERGATVAVTSGKYRDLSQDGDQAWEITAQMNVQDGAVIDDVQEYRLQVEYSGTRTLYDGVGAVSLEQAPLQPEIVDAQILDQTGLVQAELGNLTVGKTYRVEISEGDSIYAAEEMTATDVTASLTLQMRKGGSLLPLSSYDDSFYVELYRVESYGAYYETSIWVTNPYFGEGEETELVIYPDSFMVGADTVTVEAVCTGAFSLWMGKGDVLTLLDESGSEIGRCDEPLYEEVPYPAVGGTLQITGTAVAGGLYTLCLNGTPLGVMDAKAPGVSLDRLNMPTADLTDESYTMWANFGIVPIQVILMDSGSGRLVLKDSTGTEIACSEPFLYENGLFNEYSWSVEAKQLMDDTSYDLYFREEGGAETKLLPQPLVYDSTKAIPPLLELPLELLWDELLPGGESIGGNLYIVDSLRNITVSDPEITAMIDSMIRLVSEDGSTAITVKSDLSAPWDGSWEYLFTLTLSEPVPAGKYILWYGQQRMQTLYIGGEPEEPVGEPMVWDVFLYSGILYVYGENLPEGAYQADVYRGYEKINAQPLSLNRNNSSYLTGDVSTIAEALVPGSYEVRVSLGGKLLTVADLRLTEEKQPTITLSESPLVRNLDISVSAYDLGDYAYIRLANSLKELNEQPFDLYGYWKNSTGGWHTLAYDEERRCTLYVELSKTGNAEDESNLFYAFDLWYFPAQFNDIGVEIPEELTGRLLPDVNGVYTVSATAPVPAVRMWMCFVGDTDAHGVIHPMTYSGPTEDGKYAFTFSFTKEEAKYWKDVMDPGQKYDLETTAYFSVLATDFAGHLTYEGLPGVYGNALGSDGIDINFKTGLALLGFDTYIEEGITKLFTETKEQTYTMVGLAEPNSTVTVMKDAASPEDYDATYTVTADRQGRFSIVLDLPTEGDYNWFVSCQETGESLNHVTIHVDRTPPRVENLVVTKSSTGWFISWTGDDEYIKYRVLQNGEQIKSNSSEKAVHRYYLGEEGAVAVGDVFTLIVTDSLGNQATATYTTESGDLPTPQNLQATAYTKKVKLTWDAVPVDGVEYVIYKDDKYLMPYAKTNEYWVDMGMGETATFQVEAVDAEGNSSEKSQSVTVTTATMAIEMTEPVSGGSYVLDAYLEDGLPVEAALTVTPEGYDPGETQVFVYCRDAGGNVVHTITPNRYELTCEGRWKMGENYVPKFQPGEYTMWAKIVDEYGAEAVSESITITLTRDAVAPADFEAPVMKESDASSITLQWAQTTDDNKVWQYEVYRAATAGELADVSSLKPIAILPYTEFYLEDVLEYKDSGLEEGSKWYYAVAAVDIAGNRAVTDPVLMATQLYGFTQIPDLAKSYVMDVYGQGERLELTVTPDLGDALNSGAYVRTSLEYRLQGEYDWQEATWQRDTVGNDVTLVWRFQDADGEYLAPGIYEMRFKAQGVGLYADTVAYSEVQLVELLREDIPPVIHSFCDIYDDEVISGKDLRLTAEASDLVQEAFEIPGGVVETPDGPVESPAYSVPAIEGDVDYVEFFYTDSTAEDAVFTRLGVSDSKYSIGGSNYSYYLDWPAAADWESGTYRLKAVAYDLAGNASQPAYAAVTLNNSGPTAVPNPIIAKGVVGAIEVTYTAPETLPEGVTDVHLYRSDAPDSGFRYMNLGWDADETWTYTDYVDFYGNGNVERGKTYYYYAVYVDQYGNEGLPSEIASAAALDDTVAPTFTTNLLVKDAAGDWIDLLKDDTLCNWADLRIEVEDDHDLDRNAVKLHYRPAGSEAEWVCYGQFFYGWGYFDLGWSLSYLELSGDYEIKVSAADTFGNTAETKPITITVRPYSPPVAPVATGVSGYREAKLTWTYDGDVENLRHFLVYSYWGGLKNCVAAVPAGKTGSYTVKLNDTNEHAFVVVAEDLYGEKANSNVVGVKSIGELVPPTATILPETLTAATNMPFTFSGVNSFDESGIKTYAWDFGDGATGEGALCRHTYTEAGTYKVKLTVTDNCGNTGSVTADITVYDTSAENGTHGLTSIRVVNGYEEGTPAVGDAEVVVVDAQGNVMGAGTTGKDGGVQLLLPVGAWTVSVLADGYMPANRTLTVQAGDSDVITIGIAKVGVPTVTGGLSADPMTKEEMRRAGIDLNHPDNQQVWEFKVQLEFMATPTVPFKEDLKWFVNQVGQIVGDETGGWHQVEEEEGSGGGGDGTRPNKKYNIGIFPVSEHFVMIIYGEAHWLKEMYRVELVVINNSYTDQLTDCQATLTLPEGLSLANMLSRQQNETIVMGNIGAKAGPDSPANTGLATWYVRGDKEGSYSMSATATGYIGSETTPFVYTYTSNSIKVYAGSALHLTVEAGDMAYFGEDYTVKFTLKNVSDKDLYNLSFGLTGLEQFSVKTINGVEQPPESLGADDFSGGKTLSLPTMEPGQAIEIIVTTTCLFFDKDVEMIVHLADLGPVEVGYALRNFFITTLEGSTTEIPTTLKVVPVQRTTFFEYVVEQAGEKIEDAPKDFVVDNTIGELFEEIPFIGPAISAAEKAHEYKTVMDEGMETDITIKVTNGTFARAGSSRARSTGAIMVTIEPETGTVTYSEDGSTATLTGSGKVYVRSLSEGQATMEVQTCAVVDGEMKRNLYTATYQVGGDETVLGVVQEIRLPTALTEPVQVPLAGETTQMSIPHGVRYSESNWLRGTGTWSIDGDPAGLQVENGVLTVDSTAVPGEYTLRLTAGTLQEETTITVVGESLFTDLQLSPDWQVTGTLEEMDRDVLVICALYNADKQMLDCHVAEIADDAEDRSLTASLSGSAQADHVRVFLLDSSYRPLNWAVKLSQ